MHIKQPQVVKITMEPSSAGRASYMLWCCHMESRRLLLFHGTWATVWNCKETKALTAVICDTPTQQEGMQSSQFNRAVTLKLLTKSVPAVPCQKPVLYAAEHETTVVYFLLAKHCGSSWKCVGG